jgi:hypothetical protein
MTYVIKIRDWTQPLYVSALSKITDYTTSASGLKMVKIEGYTTEVININIDNNLLSNTKNVEHTIIVNNYLIDYIQEIH